MDRSRSESRRGMKSLTLLGAASMLSVLSAMVSTSARASSLDPAQGSPQPGNAASTAVPQPAPGCSVSGASDGEVQARIAEGILEVVSKQAGGDPVCATVKLPALGRDAVVRAGVAYVSLASGGLAIVNLADPAHPTVDRTVDSYRAVASLRVVDDILWTVDANTNVVKYELRNLQPRKQQPLESPLVNTTSTDRQATGRVVVLRDGKRVVGQLVELVPNERITLLRVNGQTTTIQFDQVLRVETGNIADLLHDSEPPSVRPAESIRVRIQSDRSIDLFQLDSDDRETLLHRGVRNTEIQLAVSSAKYRVAGDNVPKEEFVLPPAQRALVVVHPGNSDRSHGGMVALILGAALAVIGGAGLGGTAVATSWSTSNSSSNCVPGAHCDTGSSAGSTTTPTPKDYTSYQVGFGISLGLGLVGAIAGPVLVGISGTSLKVSPDTEYLVLSRASGIRLSSRGIEF